MYFLFDIGGTHTRGAVSNGETILRKKIVETPDTFSNGMNELALLAKELAEGNKITACAGGVPGVLNKDKKSLYSAPHLLDWVEKPIVDKLGEALGVRVKLENDSTLAALGEAIYGAGKNNRIVMYYTIGTGIGGARIVDGKIDAKVFGFEPGHQMITISTSFEENNIVNEDSILFEELCSGSGIQKRLGIPPSEMSDPSFWITVQKNLAVGIYNSILHWSPDVIVIGGGLVSEGVISADTLNDEMSKYLMPFPEIPLIKKSELGDESGLWGALAFLKSQ